MAHDDGRPFGAGAQRLTRATRRSSTTRPVQRHTANPRPGRTRRANLVELEADGASGHRELASLRLYNPESHQWSLNVFSSQSGVLGVPTIGEFKEGRGEFYDQETFGGRVIWVRFVISDITPQTCHFEQAFSDDGGRTWEVNWIATDTRIKP